jgi:hypothetical protein
MTAELEELAATAMEPPTTGPRAVTARWGLRGLVCVTLALTFGATLTSLTQAGGPVVVAIVFALATTSFLVAGWLICERRPGNLVGPIVLALGLLLGAFIVADAWIRYPGARPGIPALALAVSVSDGLYFFIIAMLFLHFPDGRPPGPRWRYLVWVMAALATITFIGALTRPGPFPYYGWLENPLNPPDSPIPAVWELAYGATVLCVAFAALSMLARWRRAGAIERAQLKWAAAAAVLVATAMVTYGAGAGPSNYSEVGDLAVGVTLGMFPIAIGIAVLRYRLYEIDRIISRTLGWALVTGVLVGVFAILVVTLQAVLAPLTDNNTLAVAASTLVAFALFQPLRRRVQRAVDRRFDRARYDGQRTVEAFAERLRNQVDLRDVERDFTTTVAGALNPSSATLWIRLRRSS